MDHFWEDTALEDNKYGKMKQTEPDNRENVIFFIQYQAISCDIINMFNSDYL